MNYVLVDSLLETQKNLYNILFIQKPPWKFIHFTLSTITFEEDKVISTFIHSSYLDFYLLLGEI